MCYGEMPEMKSMPAGCQPTVLLEQLLNQLDRRSCLDDAIYDIISRCITDYVAI